MVMQHKTFRSGSCKIKNFSVFMYILEQFRGVSNQVAFIYSSGNNIGLLRSG